jgi:peptide/nickel transport system substrate-binding protein
MKKVYIAVVAILVILLGGGAGYWYLSTKPGGEVPEQKPPPPPVKPKEVVLTVPRGGDVMTLDPSESYSVPTHEVITPVYETLLRYDPKNTSRLIPWLAESWEVSEDGLSYIFHLRRNVTFTDGTPFNASCVIFSFNRTLSLGMGPAWVLSSIDIEKCAIIDPYTVKITLKYPYSSFIYALAAQWGPLIMSPTFVVAHATPDDPWAHKYLKEHMCGTGPYMLEEWVPGDHVTLVKNPNYWKGWAGNHVDKVYMPIIAESTTRRLRLEEGSIDIGGLNLEDAMAVNGTKGILVEVVPSLDNLMIFINTQREPLNNKLIRQALSYLFDYENAVKTIRRGIGSQARGPLPSALWGWDPGCPQYNFNLTKAKELIEEAGYKPEDISLEIWYVGTIDEERRCAELLQSAAAKIGIKITPRGVTWAALIDAARPGAGDARNATDMTILYWYPDFADPDDYLSNMYYCYNESAPTNINSYPFFNWGYYCNSKLDRILEEATRTTDFSTRVELYKQAQRIIVEDAPAIFVFDEPAILTYRDWVKGYYFNPCYVGCIDFYSISIEGRP